MDPPIENGDSSPAKEKKQVQPFEIAVARKLEARSNSLLDTFLALDTDGDGAVTRNDFMAALHNLWGIDLSEDEMNALFSRFAHLNSHHGIRYPEFVEYVHDTASANMATSSSSYGALISHHSSVNYKNGLPRFMTVEPPQEAKTHELRMVLRRLFRQKTNYSNGGMPARDMFLAMDKERNGVVSVEVFQSWCETMGVRLTDEQVKQVWGYHYHEESKGIRFAEFSKFIRELDEVDSGSGVPWEQVDAEDIKNKRLMERQAAIVATEQLHDALKKGVADGTTDREMIRPFLERLYKKKTTMLDAFKKFDEEGAGKLSADDLTKALQEAGMDVSEARVASLVQKFDQDGDGRINKSEFVRLLTSDTEKPLVMEKKELTNTERAHLLALHVNNKYSHTLDAYKKFNVTSNGFLTVKKMQVAFAEAGVTISPAQIEAIIESYDKDKDGMLSKGEFTQLIFYANKGGGVIKSATSSDKGEKPLSTEEDIEEIKEKLMAAGVGHEAHSKHVEVTKNLDADDVKAIATLQQALEEERIFARKMFERMDDDKTGNLTVKQLEVGLQRLGITLSDDHLSHIMLRYDPERTGRLNYIQFTKMLAADLDK
uniref:EF-hand domain-containing protein n=1 Tax=Attheya septentrionalis TaxID=420275 RepID=A0A7S2UJ50_9STRA|mmetsp:Transcript_27802/g.50511  ORF Transcript_27802/g.50511 Transcript_27802/m.50511 type:complete len:600 (+) Transcript_27802:2142-3941(+)|eukprot:CAMPEP_0198292406 /NCGR_PEP_ID=MMETSP1449-20131203/11969_1 /TAXON_ID=420275 /ORGANISM="Attheya septentrionalis, Strain CCMP2084" /LENGTH=599 /DNA_ID=CAMNT_0043991431 /DNA_START=3543 /DNA_END=5342 /DNA_ORIENTATION=-